MPLHDNQRGAAIEVLETLHLTLPEPVYLAFAERINALRDEIADAKVLPSPRIQAVSAQLQADITAALAPFRQPL